jgi:membrane protease YdiL (CAAX protease family)
MPVEDLPAGRRSFPYSNWGPGMALAALLVALSAQAFLAVPIALIDGTSDEEFSTGASVLLQLLGAASFVLASWAVAAMRGADLRLALWRLGLQRFRNSAWLWMLAAIGAYLAFAAIYVALVGEPEQEDIADSFGPWPLQVLLIVFAAAISEEICFRGMLFGGMRERLPLWAAGLISAAIFGGLHVFTGPTAVPPLIAFGFILCLLYERTGSVVPGIILHMLNNSVALIAQ